MSLFWTSLAVGVAVGGWIAFGRTRELGKPGEVTDEDISAIQRTGTLERRDGLDLDAIAEAERRHREQTWDWEDPADGPGFTA
ncbi:MAG TPA: hypothetical protein VK837_05550 [Longimicrobiales bacterium]|nr:hypothetical protein [Longimicrobiales bacterium]